MENDNNLALQKGQAKVGVILALFGTGLPFLGLLRQLIEPTGDKEVILILGAVVTLFFVISLILLYSIKQIAVIEKRRFWSRLQKRFGILFLFYPFVGFLASIFLIKAGNTGLKTIGCEK